MTSDRLQALIQADLDGELSGAERAELHRAILEDPRARALHEAFRRTDAALRALPAEEPPAGLRQSILDSAMASPRTQEIGRPGAGLRGAMLLRYAAVFIGGLVVASLAFYLAEPDGIPTDPGALSGTMASAPDRARLVDEAVVTGPGNRAELRLMRSGRVAVLEARVTAESAGELELAYDPEAVGLTALASQDGEIRGSGGADGRFVLAAERGTRVHTFRFEVEEGLPARIDVAMRSGGQEVARVTLEAPAGR